MLRLKHMIVSHHGQYEYGAPKLPMTLEAIALHHLDNLDAKLHNFEQLIRDDANLDSSWTQFHHNLNRKLFKGANERRRMRRNTPHRQALAPHVEVQLSAGQTHGTPRSFGDILRHVNDPDYRPVKPRVIAKQLGLDEDRRDELKRRSSNSSSKGSSLTDRIIWSLRAAATPATAKKSAAGKPIEHRRGGGGQHFVGVFRRTAAGHGFVRPSGAHADVDRPQDRHLHPGRSRGSTPPPATRCSCG